MTTEEYADQADHLASLISIMRAKLKVATQALGEITNAAKAEDARVLADQALGHLSANWEEGLGGAMAGRPEGDVQERSVRPCTHSHGHCCMHCGDRY